MVDADDQPPFEPTLASPQGGGPHELHVRHREAALAPHVVPIDDHRAGACRKLGDILLKGLQLALQARAFAHRCRCSQAVHVQGLEDEQCQNVVHTALDGRPAAVGHDRARERSDGRSVGSTIVCESRGRSTLCQGAESATRELFTSVRFYSHASPCMDSNWTLEMHTQRHDFGSTSPLSCFS